MHSYARATASVACCLLSLFSAFRAEIFADARYRLSADFESSWNAPANDIYFHPLGDGRHLVSGNFDLLNRELIGSLAILSPQGQLIDRFSSAPFFGATVSKVSVLQNGNFRIIASLEQQEGFRFLTFSAQGSLLENFQAPLFPYAIFADGDYLFGEIFAVEINGSNLYFERLYKARLSPNGTLTRASGFTPLEVRGDVRSAMRLQDGSILIAGEFSTVNGNAAAATLIKIQPNGTLTPGFNIDAIDRLSFSAYNLRIHPLSNGEVFLQTAGESTPRFYRLLKNGSLDTTFAFPQILGTHPRTRIAAAPQNTYYVLECSLYDEATNDNLSIVRIDKNGSLDNAFRFDRDNDFFAANAFTTSALLQNGSLLVYGPKNSDGTLAFASLDDSGRATQASPGSLGESLLTHATWTPNGELLFSSQKNVELDGSPRSGISNSGVARTDGSIRALFESTRFAAFGLRDGRYLFGNFQFFSPDLEELPGLAVPSETTPLQQLTDGSWLVTRRTSGSNYQMAKLNRFGLIDPSFTPYPVLTRLGVKAWASENSIYLAHRTSDADTHFTLRRLHANGQTDSSFIPLSLNELPNQVLATSTHLYVLGNYPSAFTQPLLKGGTLKPLGARFTLSGTIESQYAPETSIRPAPLSNNAPFRAFSADGSSVVLANPIQADTLEADPADSARLYCISPTGEVSLMPEAPIFWSNASWDVAPNGSVFISGSAHLPTGILNVAGLYSREPYTFSTAATDRVAYSENEHAIEVTFADLPQFASFQWEKNGQTISGATSPILTFPKLSKEQAGTYHLRVSNGSDTRRIGPFKLEAPYHPKIVAQPQDAAAANSERITFSAFVDALPQASYQWFLDDRPIPGATQPSLEVRVIDFAQLGSYRLRARNPLGENWSDPARINPSGWWPNLKRSYDIAILKGKSLGGLYALNDGKLALYSDGKYDLVDSNGKLTYGWSESLDFGEFDHITFSSGRPRIFAYKSRVLGDGSQDRTEITFVRIADDGSIDQSFGSHILLDTSSHQISFREKPDGSVWAESKYTGLEITPNGASTTLPRPDPVPYQGILQLTTRYGARLPDNSLIYQLNSNGNLYRYKAGDPFSEYAPFDNINSSGYAILGYWESGRSLRLNTATNTLYGANLDGSIAWTLSLGSESLTQYSTLLRDRVVESQDRSRFFIASYDNSLIQQNRLFWIAEDGSNNFGENTRFGSLFQINYMVHQGGEKVAIVGFAESLYDAYTPALLLADGNHIPSSPILITEPQQASFQLISDLGPNGTFFVSSLAHQLDSRDSGPILRLKKNGDVDTSFSSSTVLAGLDPQPRIGSLRTSPNGGVIIQFQDYLAFIARVLKPDGSVAFDIDASYAGEGPNVIPHKSDGYLSLAYQQDKGTHLRRYLQDGSLDPTFSNDLKLFNESFLRFATDSKHRIYLLARNSFGSPSKLIRLTPTGQKDPSFQLPNAFTTIFDFRITPGDKVIVADEQSNRLQRLNTDGTVDSSFSANDTGVSQGSRIEILANGNILAGDLLLTPNGSRIGPIDSRIRFSPFAVHASEFTTLSANNEIVRYTNDQTLHFSNIPRDTSVSSGSRATLRVTPNAKLAYSYQWFKDGQKIEGANAPALSIPSATANDAGSYQVLVTWSGGSILLPPATLAIGNNTNMPAYGPIAITPRADHLELTWPSNNASPRTLHFSEDYLDWWPLHFELLLEDGKSQLCVPLDAIEGPLLFQLFESN